MDTRFKAVYLNWGKLEHIFGFPSNKLQDTVHWAHLFIRDRLLLVADQSFQHAPTRIQDISLQFTAQSLHKREDCVATLDRVLYGCFHGSIGIYHYQNSLLYFMVV